MLLKNYKRSKTAVYKSLTYINRIKKTFEATLCFQNCIINNLKN